MEKIIYLNGKNLTIEDVKKVAVNNWEVKIVNEARNYIIEGRKKYMIWLIVMFLYMVLIPVLVGIKIKKL